jgi:Glycosyl hydrolase family 99
MKWAFITGGAALLCLLAVTLIGGCTGMPDPEPRALDPSRLDPIERELVDAARGSLRIAPPENRMAGTPSFMVHYMPWYESPPVSTNWGWHWHMGFFEPYLDDENGLPRIASHYHPLAGPYDSGDPDLLEYHALLMRLCGIDGVIIDWYGTADLFDYRSIHESSIELAEVLGRMGLQFAICYEDQTVDKMIEAGRIDRDSALQHGLQTIAWLHANWLTADNYLKMDGRPALLTFGPQYFTRPDQWDSLFADLEPRPLLITLDGHMEAAADGSFPWMPMWASVGGELSLARTVSYLNTFSVKHQRDELLVTTAFPGFHDIYREAHVSSSYGYLADYEGETFRITLEAATQSLPQVVQIATWNDFGEGTVIEPTYERGYSHMEILQETIRQYRPELPFFAEDLRVPIEVYALRKQDATDAGIMAALDALVDAVVQEDIDEYHRLLAQLGIPRKEDR